MKFILLSPPDDRPAELTTVQALFEGGLPCYHLRKPNWDIERMSGWLTALPARWRGKVWLHSHHELANDFQVGGIHFRDYQNTSSTTLNPLSAHCPMSRSCHDIPTLKLALGHYDSVCFGPIFPSFSKPGYGPVPSEMLAPLQQLLKERELGGRATTVFALGGISVSGVEPCRKLGFDGVAVLGAIWNTPDPIRSFLDFSNVVEFQPAMSSPP
jgi:thiamine-phosphate pyrophosphorylase